jgi:6-pyruvoyltetrahydropterin/6-carboxytetrahydropterin synthase
VHRLTRQVRFAINATPDDQRAHAPTNSYAGFPSLTGLGHYFALDVTLAGTPDATSQYILNIKDVDRVVRQRGIPVVEAAVRDASFGGGAGVLAKLMHTLAGAWPGCTLECLRLALTPFLSLSTVAAEVPMIRLSQKFEFSATHRLHNPLLSDDANRRTYGKCNNPQGHGHNYEVQVTVAATPDAKGNVCDLLALERMVGLRAIEKLDHKNLNAEVPEFEHTIPSVENIARVIYAMLKPHLSKHQKLVSVTVWETPKTWCEYNE